MHQSPLEARFWRKVNKDGPIPKHCPELGPCWIWTGKTNQYGYGIAWTGFTEVRAHRAGFEYQVGPIPDGLMVLHKCDNPACVRGTHLFSGTKKDNAQDALKKGRLGAQIRTIKRLWAGRFRVTMTGENAPQSKLKEAQVLEIRKLYKKGVYGTYRLAKRFGVCQQTVHEIVTNQIWRHLKSAAASTTDATANQPTA